MEEATFLSPERHMPARPGLDGTAILGRIGALEVRLAADDDEIAEAQQIRYRIFRAAVDGGRGNARRDEDGFDALCDHLLVIDTAQPQAGREKIVGTYRLLPQRRAEAAGIFYSEQEFALRDLVARHPDRQFLELGRSCVVPEYRTRRTAELLWQGVWAYCRRNAIDVMCGCASFAGTVPLFHAQPLACLHHFHRAAGEWHVPAQAGRCVSMDMMPAEAVDRRAALAELPPLIKGYLRLGASFGDGCVIDHDFGSTDVFVVLPVEHISPRYLRYYGADAERFAPR